MRKPRKRAPARIQEDLNAIHNLQLLATIHPELADAMFAVADMVTDRVIEDGDAAQR